MILGDGGDLADSPEASGALSVTSIERLPGVREALDPPGRPRPVRETTVERSAQPSEVRIMVRDGSAPPQLLAAVEALGGEALDYATATPLGLDLIVTLTARRARLASPPTYTLDDWDDPLCVSEPVTWIQRRDGQTGALKTSVAVRGLDIATALPMGRSLWLGGSRTPGCGVASEAVVLALEGDLATRLIHSDQTPGASAVWSLSALPGGRTLVAATKVASVDAPPAGWAVSGLMFILGRDGRASTPKLLDAGAPVFVNRADTQNPHDIRLAGGIAGEGVVLHLSVGR